MQRGWRCEGQDGHPPASVYLRERPYDLSVIPPCRNLFDCGDRIRSSDHEIACIFRGYDTLLKGGITQRCIPTHNRTGPCTNALPPGDVTKAAEAIRQRYHGMENGYRF